MNGGAPRLTSREKLALAHAMSSGAPDAVDAALPAKGLFALPFMRRALRKQGADVAAEAQAVLNGEHHNDAQAAPAKQAPSRRAFGGTAAALRGAEAAQAASGSESASGDEDEDAEGARGRRRESDAAEARMAGADAARRASGAAAESVRVISNKAAPHSRGAVSMQADGVVEASLPSVVLSAKPHSKVATADTRSAPAQAHALRANAPDEAPAAQAAPQATSQRTLASPLPKASNSETGRAADDAAAAEASGVVPVDTAAAMAAAFAGDDVVADFEAEKAEAAKESTEGVADPQALPGWGTWASTKREPRCALCAALQTLQTACARIFALASLAAGVAGCA